MRNLLCAAILVTTALAQGITRMPSGLTVTISVGEGILNNGTDGHVQLVFAPLGIDPLDAKGLTAPNYFFGQNVYGLGAGSSVVFSSTSNTSDGLGVSGYNYAGIDTLQPGDYSIQGIMNVYEKANRADGSVVSARFPCGDGAVSIGGFGSPLTPILNVAVTGQAQTVNLAMNSTMPQGNFTGEEIGGCYQGNYKDTQLIKYVKIRSNVLSQWWGRDMYVGANVLLPHSYDAQDPNKRFPVLYSQDHWSAGTPVVFTVSGGAFENAWNSGTIPSASNATGGRPTPDLIVVTFRHETPFYDDSYGVNSANLGPWGDAINDELIPHIDATFRTIPQPYARVQDGGSTGGWISVASVVFRPDLFGACFSSYPDPLDFNQHQDIPLYTNANAYVRQDGSAITSTRTFENDTEVATTTVKQENYWELTIGTSTRAAEQWDVWNAVFGVQGLNHYPLEPWDKVTGQIYPEAVQYWKHLDLSEHVASNWDNDLNLGQVLKGRLFVSVGTHDDYFLDRGVAKFQQRVEAKGGSGWANFTYIQNAPHGYPVYNMMDPWEYLEMVVDWVRDHAPDGKSPLSPAVTTSQARGNKFEDIMAYGGHAAALARQEPPRIEGASTTVGKWDPGVVLEAQWFVDGRPQGPPFAVQQGTQLDFSQQPVPGSRLQIGITGRKHGYVKETRMSNITYL